MTEAEVYKGIEEHSKIFARDFYVKVGFVAIKDDQENDTLTIITHENLSDQNVSDILSLTNLKNLEQVKLSHHLLIKYISYALKIDTTNGLRYDFICNSDDSIDCPKKWYELKTTSLEKIRFCQKCFKPVNLCFEEDDALKQESKGLNVVLMDYIQSEII